MSQENQIPQSESSFDGTNLVIDRRVWLRGPHIQSPLVLARLEGTKYRENVSALLVPDINRMCCMGVLCSVLNHPGYNSYEALVDKGAPSSLLTAEMVEKERWEDFPELLRQLVDLHASHERSDFTKKEWPVVNRSDSDVAARIIETNDNTEISETEREARLISLFSELIGKEGPIQLSFIN
jgi:hypothetical protein